MSFTVAHVRRRGAAKPQRPPIAIRRPLSVREVNARIEEIAALARSLRNVSRINPHAFAEDKHALVQAIERLQQDRRLGVAD